MRGCRSCRQVLAAGRIDGFLKGRVTLKTAERDSTIKPTSSAPNFRASSLFSYSMVPIWYPASKPDTATTMLIVLGTLAMLAPMNQPEVDASQLALDLASEHKPARQGHRYTHDGISVMAMENGERVEVAEIGPLWLGARHTVDARDLVPQPMAYFHGQIPA